MSHPRHYKSLLSRPRLGRFFSRPRRSKATLARHWVHALALAPIFFGIHFLAYWIRFDGDLSQREFELIARTMGDFVCVKVAVFAWFGVHRGWKRYVTFHDLVLIVQAATVASLVLAVVDYLFYPRSYVPRSVFLMDWGAAIFVICAMRSVGRWVLEWRFVRSQSIKQRPVLIVGIDDNGEMLLRSIKRSDHMPYRVVGFVADNESAVNSRVGGVPVVGTTSRAFELARRHRVQEVLVMSGTLVGRQLRRLITQTRDVGISVKVLPSYDQLLEGHLNFQTRNVSIEDLLRRDPVRLDMRRLHRWVDGQVLMITGSAGSIGSEVCRQLLPFSPKRLVLVDRSENGQFFLQDELAKRHADREIEICVADACDRKGMEQLIAKHRPSVLFHAAAYKHVSMMEANPQEAVKNIVGMTKQLADLAESQRVASFVMVSTDKAVNPTSVMGACKRVAELYVQSLGRSSRCRFVTVRFGNVLDSAGSVVPIFRQQIADGGPITITDPDMTRYFMTIPEASQLVIQAGAMGQGGEIFVLDMGEPIRILDLATDLARLSGLELGRDIEFEFVGKRPGEKSYEELYVRGEERKATAHPKIMVADCAPVRRAWIRESVIRLLRTAEDFPSEVPGELKRIIPEYTQRSGQVPPRVVRAA